MRYSIKPRERRYVKVFELLAFGKYIGKNF